MESPYYDRAQLMDYLTRAKNQGFTPSFTNRPEVMQEDEDSAKLETFAVGLRRTPEGRWEELKKKTDTTSLVGDPVSQLAAERPSLGTPLLDSVSKQSLRRVDAQSKQRAMEVEAIGPLDQTIERLGQATSSISTMLITNSNPQIAQKWQQRQAGYVQEYQNAVAMREQAMRALKLNPEYAALETAKEEAKEYEEFYGPIAEREKAHLQQLEKERMAREDQTEEMRVEAAKLVSPSTAQAAMSVLGTIDPATAAYRYANKPIDETAKTVIQAIGENSEYPENNTPLAHMADPKAYSYWYGQAYLNSMPKGDVTARATGQSLLDQMQLLSQSKAQEMLDFVKRDKKVEIYADQMGSYVTDSSKKSTDYQILSQQHNQAKLNATQEFIQNKFLAGLKNHLLTSNQDLLRVPTATVVPDMPIASAIVAGLVESKAGTWQEAMKGVESVIIPGLVSQGYNLNNIAVVKNQIATNYMEAVNGRHLLSGVDLTPSDMAVNYSLFDNKYIKSVLDTAGSAIGL